MEYFQVANRVTSSVVKTSHEDRQMKVNLAKDGVRKRRNRQMQVQFCSLLLLLFFYSFF